MRTLIYIDPGVKGAIAWRVDHFTVCGVADLPMFKTLLKSKGKSGKVRERNETDAEKAFAMLASLTDGHRQLTGIESLPNVFNTGRTAAMRQGMNYGLIKGVAESVAAMTGLGCVEVISPETVRDFHGLKGEGDGHDERKAANVAKAIELFPEMEAQILVPPQGRERKVQVKDGRADALLGLAYLIDREGREG